MFGKKWMALAMAALLLCSLLPVGALAAYRDYYIIDDSNTRKLTHEELWDWQYEALGYIYNEIFARHGRAFRSGEKYDVYFRSQEWYHVNSNYRYGLLNSVEQYNEKLVHSVLQNMRDQKTTNPLGRPLPQSDGEAYNNEMIQFRSYMLKGDQKLDVYSGPSTMYQRGGNGKAKLSTNGAVSIAGQEDGWAMVEYATSGGAMRVGFIDMSRLKDRLNLKPLEFYYDSGLIIQSCKMTDDPDGKCGTILTLPAETDVTLLCSYTSKKGEDWAYIEVTTLDEEIMRGFVPILCITGGDSELYDEYDWEDEANG